MGHNNSRKANYSKRDRSMKLRARTGNLRQVEDAARKVKCPTPGKAVFKSSYVAEKKLQEIAAQSHEEKRPCRIYMCKCGYYHLTSLKSGQTRAKQSINVTHVKPRNQTEKNMSGSIGFNGSTSSTTEFHSPAKITVVGNFARIANALPSHSDK